MYGNDGINEFSNEEFLKYIINAPEFDDFKNRTSSISPSSVMQNYLYGAPYGKYKNAEKLSKQIKEKEDGVLKLLEEAKSKSKEEIEEIKAKYQNEIKEYIRLNEINYLSIRLHPMALNVLMNPNNEMLNDFSKNESIEMTVLSIDIRKSTNLMLKATTPDNYAKFISELTEGLRKIIGDNYGVFDKFTGDGILAYFPIFYSGDNGILNSCIISQKCHALFREFYRKNYDLFDVVLDTGLGIGIDHGMVKIVKINGEQTIVGIPVVYACRLSSAPANQTYLNRNACSKLREFGINPKETTMDIKDEGTIVVYALEDKIDQEISIPPWAKDVQQLEAQQQQKTNS